MKNLQNANQQILQNIAQLKTFLNVIFSTNFLLCTNLNVEVLTPRITKEWVRISQIRKVPHVQKLYNSATLRNLFADCPPVPCECDKETT
jgi:hypothetical protein